MWALLVVWYALAYLVLFVAENYLPFGPQLAFLALGFPLVGLLGTHALFLIVREKILTNLERDLQNL